ncbi:ABC transporter G family member 37 [Hordeum vulgare]|nr:ABC transporter G family member 37 [Hordeum vulgare]
MVFRTNYGVISLIPKVVGAMDIRQFRPIMVINVLERIFAKIVHEVVSKGLKGVFLKLAFHMAYDRLQGVKQGDHVSPLLFNLAVDALASILDKAKMVGHLKGVVSHLSLGGGVTHLQYVDDTMIIVEGSDSDIVNLKFLFLSFEEMSGLKINFDKSEVVVLGYSEDEQLRIADNLYCSLTSFPISYLGMPLAESRILGIKDEIRLGLWFSVGNGSVTQFWLDPWLDGEPLRIPFPRLFAICVDPAILVSAAALDEDGTLRSTTHLDLLRYRNGQS